jgi:H+-transporting ATPase
LNSDYKDKPETWNMRLVLGVSTVLGVIGVVSAFGLFYLGERVFHLDRAHIQTLMYLTRRSRNQTGPAMMPEWASS